MQIRIICVGKLKEKYLQDAQKEYLKRLSRFCRTEIIEIDEERAPASASPAIEEKIRQKEAERINKALQKNSYIIALAIEGKELDSVAFSNEVQRLMVDGISDITFIIGSSTGLDNSIIKACDYRLSLSKMTFPHQLARIILLEQIYRVFKINNYETYHK